MFRRFRPIIISATALGLALAILPPTAANAHGRGGHSPVFPTEIALPNGFQPEGIAIGAGPFAFVGSLVDGDLYQINLITGEGQVFSQGPGTPSVGLKVDHRKRLFVAGGPAGNARVVSAITGGVLASYTFASGATFINDVVLTRDAAWFTDSMRAVLYKLPLGRSGALPDQSEVQVFALTGDWVQVAGFNANGISLTPDGKALLVVQSATGLLFRVDPATGVATVVDLGGYLVSNGDGLLLRGRSLYVVQNTLNLVAVIRLNSRGTSGELVDQRTDARFDVPTTVAAFGNRLYLPNARFGTPPTPTTTYTVVAVRH
jgi:sugar lactone lactonase YvrE